MKLDGAPITTPASFDGVVGMMRSVEAVSPQTVDFVRWSFESWSDGGAARHDIATPASDTTYTATLGPAPAESGFVGHWNMNVSSVSASRLADASGLGNHGAISGAVLAPGVMGESMSFDGVDDRVDIPGAPALDTSEGFTVAFWYLADANSGSILAKPFGSERFRSWQFEFEPAGLSFTSFDGTNSATDVAAIPAAGVWVHVAGTWDGVTKTLFVNGAPVLGEARTIAMDAGDVVIGGDYGGGQFTAPFEGRVDDVRLYDHALTTLEIQQLHESAAADTTRPSVPVGLTTTGISYSRVDRSIWRCRSNASPSKV